MEGWKSISPAARKEGTFLDMELCFCLERDFFVGGRLGGFFLGNCLISFSILTHLPLPNQRGYHMVKITQLIRDVPTPHSFPRAAQIPQSQTTHPQQSFLPPHILSVFANRPHQHQHSAFMNVSNFTQHSQNKSFKSICSVPLLQYRG